MPGFVEELKVHLGRHEEPGAMDLGTPHGPVPGVAAAAAPPERGDDLRAIPVKYDVRGERCRDFRAAVDLMSGATWPDFLIKGPRSALWVARFRRER